MNNGEVAAQGAGADFSNGEVVGEHNAAWLLNFRPLLIS